MTSFMLKQHEQRFSRWTLIDLTHCTVLSTVASYTWNSPPSDSLIMLEHAYIQTTIKDISAPPSAPPDLHGII